VTFVRHFWTFHRAPHYRSYVVSYCVVALLTSESIILLVISCGLAMKCGFSIPLCELAAKFLSGGDTHVGLRYSSAAGADLAV